MARKLGKTLVADRSQRHIAHIAKVERFPLRRVGTYLPYPK